MNAQLQPLLEDSYSHYRKRHLKKALNSAKIALEFGRNGKSNINDLIKTNLLLARIYNTNGRFTSDTSFYKKALQHIAEAIQLNKQENDPLLKMHTYLICGRINMNYRNFEKAKCSLNKALAVAKELDNIYGITHAIGVSSRLAINQNEVDKGIQLAEEALDVVKKNVKSNHLDLWNEVYLHLSQAYIKKQDYSKSLEMSQELLRISRESKDIENEVIALRNIAVVCGVKSNYKIGMQYFLEALDKCEPIGYKELYVQLQVNIGTLYAHLYNYPEAVRRYEKALNDDNDILKGKNKLVVYNNLGNIYLSTHKPKKALEYFEKSHLLAQKYQYKFMQAHALAQLSRTKLQLAQLPGAKHDARLAQRLIEELGEINGKQINLLNKGEIAFQEQDYEKAELLTLAAIETSKNLKDDACEIRCYKHMSRIRKAIGDYKTALEYEEKFGKIQEAFAKEQHNRQFLDMEIRHAIKEKQKAIEQLTRENDYQSLLLQKSDQIARQNDELLRVNEDLKQFAYVASHDLKEPVRMIGSFTQIIQRKTKKLLPEEDHQYFDFINGGVKRINELLDGLLKYATVGNTDTEMDYHDMKDITNICLANLYFRIQESGATISQEELPIIYANKSMVSQLMQNLIGNALKFTKKGESPVIKIGSLNAETEHIIYVQDNGIGISENSKEKIFEIFHRLHSREEYEGTGIGLAICQKIAKRMNGRLWVKSETGEGSTFYFAVPKK
ncbi:MAG TPA: DUF2225 domain-containing protein [Bacteroidetes bacterium]|nr:DUF2225 domain-containing protein [Bacteroidota bacterium]